MAIFFISDTHFGHATIIGLCKRPFADADAMDEVMIARWNETVGPDDTVYHLGDMTYRSSRRAGEYLDRLNGEVHLVAGNHDTLAVKYESDRFASVTEINEIEVDGHHIVLCHYPMREWNGAWRGSWHLFGHTHGRFDQQPCGYSLDVGADSHDFRPWSMTEIAEVFATRTNPFVSSRGRKSVANTPIRAF
jgi:calcineurin-like phosphoesterase family protein